MVLVVDDDPLGRAQVQIALEPEHRVMQAPDAETALRLADESPPDLVLLDIAMPGLGGHGFLRRWMADDRWRSIPVICVTGRDTAEEEQQGLRLGAVDYITKPYVLATLAARVRTHLDLRRAHLRLGAQAAHLERQHAMIEDIIERQRAAADFDPRHLNFAMSPVERTAGDLLLSATTPGGRQWVLVGDISGHGLPAAVCGILVSHIFYRESREGDDLAQALGRINAALCQELPAQIFMPCAALEIDFRQGRCRLWNTGLPGCLYWPADDILDETPPSLLPMGIECGLDFAGAARTLAAGPGDRHYFFTDGLTELRTASGAYFGAEGAIDFLYQSRGEFSVDSLFAHLDGIRGPQAYLDDITLVEVAI